MRLPGERDDEVWRRIRTHDVEELWDHSISPHVAAAYAARIGLVSHLIQRHAPQCGTIIDVGCAQGTVGLRMAEQGYRVTLLDVRGAALEYARARYERGQVEYVEGRAEGMLSRGDQYDAVVCTEVLEHVAAPGEFLSVLAKLVRRGGSMIVTTPNADYALARLPSYSRAAQEVVSSAEADSMDGDAHRYLFTREELVALLRGVGLAVTEAGFFSPFWLQGHLKTRAAHRLLYRLRGRILAPPLNWTAGTRWIPRVAYGALWAVATKK